MGLERFHEVRAPVAADRFKPSEEEAHHRRLFNEAKPADEVPVMVEPRHAIRDILNLAQSLKGTVLFIFLPSSISLYLLNIIIKIMSRLNIFHKLAIPTIK